VHTRLGTWGAVTAENGQPGPPSIRVGPARQDTGVSGAGSGLVKPWEVAQKATKAVHHLECCLQLCLMAVGSRDDWAKGPCS